MAVFHNWSHFTIKRGAKNSTKAFLFKNDVSALLQTCFGKSVAKHCCPLGGHIRLMLPATLIGKLN